MTRYVCHTLFLLLFASLPRAAAAIDACFEFPANGALGFIESCTSEICSSDKSSR